MNDSQSKSAASGPDVRNVLLGVFVATFDVFLRSSAEITAETGLSRELTVETLMAYCLSLAEPDELITGFLRGDLTIISLAEQTRQMVERDTRFLELEAVGSASTQPVEVAARLDRLGRKLDLMKRVKAPGGSNEKAPALAHFIRDNPAIFAQVNAASRDFLVRWVMYYLMQGTKSRERGHQVAHEFWKQFPEVGEKIKALCPSPSKRSHSIGKAPVSARLGSP